jgi:uncharacterized membrane protein
MSGTLQLAPESERRRRAKTLQFDLRDPMVLAVAALTVFTFVLRLSQIHQSLYGDEAWTYTDILGKSFRSVLTNVHSGGENSPPLFFLLAYATGKLGDLSVWIRLPSIVFGALTIPLLYLIGRETVGRAAGLLAGAIVALSPFSFYYGVEARPYATMAFFVALSTWALLRAVDSDRWGWWALYVVATAGAAYSHYTSVFVLSAQGAWSLWACRNRIRAPLISAAAAVILYIPWIGHLRGKELAVIGFLHPLTAHNVIADLMRPIAGYPGAPLSAIPTYVGLGLVIASALLGALSLGRDHVIARGWRPSGLSDVAVWPRHFWLLTLLAVITPIGMLIYSLTETDLWLPRGLYASVPAGALVLGALLAALPRPIRVIAIVALLGTLVFGTIEAARPEWKRPPARAIAAYLDRSAAARDPVAFVSTLGQPAVLDEVRKPHRVVEFSALAPSTPPGASAYVVLDEATARSLRRAYVPPAPKGFVLVSHRHYSSELMPFDVSVYRRH